MDATLEEALSTVLLIFFITHFHIPILEPVQSSLFAAASDDQTVFGKCAALAIWSVACTLMFRSFRSVFLGLRGIGWTIAFVAIAFASAAWSQDAGLTTRKAVFLILTTLFGIYFARKFSIEAQMRMICIAGLLTALLSIFFALFLPAYGMDHDAHQGVWVGIFTQKNVCAREMLFLLASALAFRPPSRNLRLCRFLAIPAILAVIIGTRSKTALLITFALLSIFPALAFYRRVSRGIVFATLTAGLAVASIVFALAASAIPRLLQMMGRDGTMTGRTEIWRAVLEAIMKHPLLGYGFAAFWLSLRGESANVILSLRWAVPAAHNGFLEIWLQLGALGLSIFLIGFVRAFRVSLVGLRQPSYAKAIWPFIILVLTLVYNVDESSLMQPNDFLWLLYVATMVNLAHFVVQQKSNQMLLVPRRVAV